MAEARLQEGQRGLCFVRAREGDEMVLLDGRTVTAYPRRFGVRIRTLDLATLTDTAFVLEVSGIRMRGLDVAGNGTLFGALTDGVYERVDAGTFGLSTTPGLSYHGMYCP